MKPSELKKLYNELGISYLGSVAQSAKLKLSKKNGTMTYCIYLAPSDMSGFNVCPNSRYCREHCLNGSGNNKADIFAHGAKYSKINQCRIKKTQLFFKNHRLFMDIMIAEIEKYKERAKRLNYHFSVRINGTSDLSPLAFTDSEGRNILEIFRDVQFYDYTKVPSRIGLMQKYDNYFLVLSYNGHNWNECEKFLQQGGNVAVVFYGEMPTEWRGWPVCDGNEYDMRYLDPRQHIVGLHYHKTASDYYLVNGKRVFQEPKTDFVVVI